MNYVREINFVMLVLLLIALAILTGLAYLLTRSDEKLQKAREEIVRLVALSEDLHKTEFEHSQRLEQQRDEARRQRDTLRRENADMHEELRECQELHKASQRQTVEVEVVKPAKPRRKNGQFATKGESDG